ncbi:MAG: GAF domain-containing protein, partial [Planctomycetota bacterium]|nr:GAF domain-containing protein [Planctomycetota bacterium]
EAQHGASDLAQGRVAGDAGAEDAHGDGRDPDQPRPLHRRERHARGQAPGQRVERRLPLDDVTYSGFIYIRYVEISELHNLSLLKSELVEPGALQAPERVVQRLRSILGFTDLEVGVVLRYEAYGAGSFCNNRSLLRGHDGCMARIEGSLYARAIESRQAVYVPDLEEHEGDAQLVGLLRADGYRSLGLIPLVEDDEVIALLELGSRRAEAITPAVSHKFQDLLTPLTVAARREMDETTSAVERAIKAHCTAIHPSVAWRFEEAAFRYTLAMAESGSAVFEPIVFDNVHPLYGAMDIRGSSSARNTAIESDLLEQIDLARDTLASMHAVRPMPIVDYYDAALAKFRSSVAGGLSSGDEISVIEFLHTRIETFFRDVQGTAGLPRDEQGSDAMDRYFAALDPNLGILYRKRKQYEHSVSLINNTLGSFVEGEQVKAQAMYPHYFEMFKTDGVEHDMYVGRSMTQDQDFSEVQLKNLRLWQLILMCEQARIAEDLVAQMEVPLRTTPLVLVQSSPITIQFSADEKQFAVEGSYNIRYEIIKKRIDKSTIRGTGERLTQPGMLAVIYSHDKEYEEYHRYFEYLSEKGLLEGDVESLALDDLQGVSGLRALRAAIRLG